MRAGSPCDFTRSRASVIQRRERLVLGERAQHGVVGDARGRSGSPESTAQRNGPLPSQKSGRMYAGTKPGKSKASSTPAFCGLGADVVAVVEGDGALRLEVEHGAHVLAHAAARLRHVARGIARRAARSAAS